MRSASSGKRFALSSSMARAFGVSTPSAPTSDFVCLEKRLIVEVDGPQHAEDEHVVRDARRDRGLSDEGYRVMRFQTIDVYQNLGGVVDTIWAALWE
jgi:very-short-patch-repair endonuclease